MRISVIIPTFNAHSTINALYQSLLSQTYEDFEIIFVDDSSTDGTADTLRDYNCHLIQLKENRGPAYCRNRGAKKARGDLLVFTDSDCRVDRNWLHNIQEHFANDEADAVMGRLELLPSNFLGEAISSLGFPAGGRVGFDKMWRVDNAGFTESLSTCNCSVRKNIFLAVGGFDETFPYPGGEDSLLAYHLRKAGYSIRYCPDVLAYHDSRDSLNGFLKWQFRRGISSFVFSTKVSKKKKFFSLRMWSTKNIIRRYYSDIKFPLILFLLGVSGFTQLCGYLFARYHKDLYERPHH